MTKIDEKLLDAMAQLEVNALLAGLKDAELSKNPSFLEKVRKFLKDNQLKTQPETPGYTKIQKATEDIPIYEDLN